MTPDRSCHCLCSQNHPEQLNVCNGNGGLRQLSFWLPDSLGEETGLWSVPVPLCWVCLTAILAPKVRFGATPRT